MGTDSVHGLQVLMLLLQRQELVLAISKDPAHALDLTLQLPDFVGMRPLDSLQRSQRNHLFGW